MAVNRFTNLTPTGTNTLDARGKFTQDYTVDPTPWTPEFAQQWNQWRLDNPQLAEQMDKANRPRPMWQELAMTFGPVIAGGILSGALSNAGGLAGAGSSAPSLAGVPTTVGGISGASLGPSIGTGLGGFAGAGGAGIGSGVGSGVGLGFGQGVGTGATAAGTSAAPAAGSGGIGLAGMAPQGAASGGGIGSTIANMAGYGGGKLGWFNTAANIGSNVANGIMQAKAANEQMRLQQEQMAEQKRQFDATQKAQAARDALSATQKDPFAQQRSRAMMAMLGSLMANWQNAKYDPNTQHFTGGIFFPPEVMENVNPFLTPGAMAAQETAYHKTASNLGPYNTPNLSNVGYGPGALNPGSNATQGGYQAPAETVQTQTTPASSTSNAASGVSGQRSLAEQLASAQQLLKERRASRGLGGF